MKVAQLSTRYPPGPGGVERHVAEVATRLGARGHSVEVYTSDLYREFPMQRLAPAVPREEHPPFGSVHRLPVWSLPWELHYPFFRGMESALVRDRPDVVHAHTYGTHQVAVARRYRARSGTPFVLTAHFHPIWSIHGGWLRHRIRGFYDRRLAGPVRRRGGTGDRPDPRGRTPPPIARAHAAPDRDPPARVFAAPVPPEGAAPFRDRMGIPGPFVLFVGRLASNKGLVDLLLAFAALARDDPAAHLVLVGEDGGMRATLEARTRSLGLEPRVHFLGHLPDDALLTAAYRDAAFTVLPSEYEAFGLVLLESLAAGHAGRGVPGRGDPRIHRGRAHGPPRPSRRPAPALTAAIRRLWSEPALARRLGRHGRTEVVPRYTWDRVVDRLEVVYREVLGR